MPDKNNPAYERPQTPPPCGIGPQLPHKPKQEWDTPTIARVRQMKQDGFSAQDIYKQQHVSPRTQRRMCARISDRRSEQARKDHSSKIDQDTVYKMKRHI